ncbi:MerR family transcriptional regulator [Clostridium estertheticum]|uniref:MerR family transcriptional regulator n=1 Tax=Clostridium estertheticum TaxID=238834 RepID=UPI0013E98353|nr:MerR family transcriptional regulator [Clostridium estertheticum]MBZ9686305.1 MerR family transcriptional regulator [Clostridium estertheticum]
MRIGKFAETNKLSIDTIRHYMDLELIIPEKHNGQYYFDSRCQKDLDDILNFKSMGFSLNDIKTIFFYKGFGMFAAYQEDVYYKALFMDKYKKLENDIDKLIKIKDKLQIKIENLNLVDSTFKEIDPLGIDLRNLSFFKCNKCSGNLILMDGVINNNQVIEGKLKCSCGEEYYIEDGILKVGEVCTKSKVNFNHDFVMEYVNVTDTSYLDNLRKGFEWMFRKISDCNLNNKVLLELGTGVGFFLRNIYNEIPDNCLYIAVDHDFDRQKFLKSLFERIDCKKNIIFICSDFLEVPIKEKSVDIVLDISGTSNYSFEHEDFLLNLVDSYIKDDGYLFGLYILFENFSTNSLIENNYRKNFILKNVKESIGTLKYKSSDEKTWEFVEKGGKYDDYFVEGEKIYTYSFYGKR